MTPLELTEPLFQYVCRLNRLGRRSNLGMAAETTFISRTAQPAPVTSTLDYAVVRSEVKALLEEMAQKASDDPRLASQLKQLELPLLFFTDSMIAESHLPISDKWNQNRIAYDRNELAGDEKFFDLLDETMKDSGDEASERLAVYYTCLGLGFTGIYFKQPEFLRKTMMSIAPRIRKMMDTEPNSKICPEAYEHVDTRNLVQPPGSRLIFVGIIFVCFLLAVLAAYTWMYRASARNLEAALPAILKNDLRVKK
jgi:type VI secretion system protein ImpK